MRARAKPWGRDLRGFLGWLPVGLGLQTGHPTGTAGFGLTLQLGNPFLQARDDGLLAYADGDEHIPVNGGQVNFRIHTRYMT